MRKIGRKIATNRRNLYFLIRDFAGKIFALKKCAKKQQKVKK